MISPEEGSSGSSSHTALRTSVTADRRDRASLPPPLPEGAPYSRSTRKWALVAVVVLSFVAATALASPIWIPIVLGAVMGISAHRPFRALARRIGGRSNWAAALVTLGAGLLLAALGSVVLATLTNELMKLVVHLDQHVRTGSLSGLLGDRAARAIEELGVDTERVYAWAQRELEAAASFAASAAAVVVRTTSHALLGLVVALMTMYYVLREGSHLALRLERIAPLEPRHTRELLVEAREVARTAFFGTIATAIVQGVLAGIGYVALGVPQPVMWAVVTSLASFLPLIGTLIVWVPIAGYLLMVGHPVRALILVVWGVLVITSLADYVIRPRIVGVRGHGHPLLTLIALLGGIELFGLAGLMIAPIVMSVFVAAFRLYEREARAGGVLGQAAPESERPQSVGPPVTPRTG